MSKNTVDILDVVRVEPSESELLFSYAIDKPKKGNKIDGSEIEIVGWIVGKKSPAVAVEVVNAEKILQQISVNEPRPDVGQRYPELPEAKNIGFMATIDLLGLPETDELLLEAILKDESKILIGRVAYQLDYAEEESQENITLEEESQENITLEEQKSTLDLEEIKVSLEKSRTFLKKIQEDLEQMGVG